jgi:putative transposase
MNIRKELLDELLQECKTPPDLFGEGGILKQLTTALVERALEAELSMHLGYKKHESRPETVATVIARKKSKATLA